MAPRPTYQGEVHTQIRRARADVSTEPHVGFRHLRVLWQHVLFDLVQCIPPIAVLKPQTDEKRLARFAKIGILEVVDN